MEEVAREPGNWVAIARFPKIRLQPDGGSIMGVGSFFLLSSPSSGRQSVTEGPWWLGTWVHGRRRKLNEFGVPAPWSDPCPLVPWWDSRVD
jgi:hypothetical protein